MSASDHKGTCCCCCCYNSSKALSGGQSTCLSSSSLSCVSPHLSLSLCLPLFAGSVNKFAQRSFRLAERPMAPRHAHHHHHPIIIIIILVFIFIEFILVAFLCSACRCCCARLFNYDCQNRQKKYNKKTKQQPANFVVAKKRERVCAMKGREKEKKTVSWQN